MIFTETILKGSYIIDLNPFKDERGWFARTFCKNEFFKIGLSKEWVQMNHSFTQHQGTIRGMHYQLAPYMECKLIRCIAGSVFDVIVDIRKDSPTFLQWFGTELSSENKKMIYIPEGFAHGFQSMSDNAELIYHHTEFYKPESEMGIRYNDKRVNIIWQLPVSNISERDMNHPAIDENFKGLK